MLPEMLDHLASDLVPGPLDVDMSRKEKHMGQRSDRSPARALLIAAAAILCASPAAAGDYHARGTFYAGTGEIWGCDAGNRLYDDGLHGDGAAGDGIFAAYVVSDQAASLHEWKIASADWTENYPLHPGYPLANAILYTMSPGETIHFRLDTNTRGEGWQPAANAVSCSHFTVPSPGLGFELIGSAPELGAWESGIPVVMAEDLWTLRTTIGSPGAYEFKFRVSGTWDICNLGIHYNMFMGDNFTFETVEPQTVVRFEFDPADGRARAVLEGPVRTETRSWGAVKGLYR
jgi:hypothetical protein